MVPGQFLAVADNLRQGDQFKVFFFFLNDPASLFRGPSHGEAAWQPGVASAPWQAARKDLVALRSSRCVSLFKALHSSFSCAGRLQAGTCFIVGGPVRTPDARRRSPEAEPATGIGEASQLASPFQSTVPNRDTGLAAIAHLACNAAINQLQERHCGERYYVDACGSTLITHQRYQGLCPPGLAAQAPPVPSMPDRWEKPASR